MLNSMVDARIIFESGLANHNHNYLACNAFGSQFTRVHSQGRWSLFLSRLTGRDNRLQSIEGLAKGEPVQISHLQGVRRVPIRQIRGSESRYVDFDTKFRPLKSHLKDRWINIAAARERGATLPAVELIQIAEDYFVRDGHHRISVARTWGQTEIEAQVVLWLF